MAAMLAVWTFCGLGASWLAVPAGIVPRVAGACALLCLIFSAAAVPSIRLPNLPGFPLAIRTSRQLLAHLALYLGVVSGILLVVMLIMRVMYVSIDQLRGFPWIGARDFGFNPFGLWPLVALNIACALGLVATGNRLLQTVQFWLVFMLAAWASYLGDPFQSTSTGGFERTDATLILAECLSSLLLIAVIMAGWLSESSGMLDRWRRRGDDFETTTNPPATIESATIPDGFRASVTIVALFLNLAVLYHILVPAGQSTSFLKASGFRAGIAATVAGVGGLLLLRKSWGAHLADATLGLFALGMCGIATGLVSGAQAGLDVRYPMIFNAISIGYALAAGLYGHLSWTWSVMNLRPESLRCRFLPHLSRFTFFCAASAMLAGVMMSFWPGVPGIAAMDDSLGRVLAGCGAFLLLLLVTLRSCRLLKRLSFHFLTVAVAACLVAFLAVRARPFVSDVAFPGSASLPYISQ